MGKNHKNKKQVFSGGRSHVVKTTQERSGYDDLIRTAPITNPTDEAQTSPLEKFEAEPVESKHTTTGVKEKRTRISTKPKKIPWQAIGSLIGLIILVATIVAFYVSLKMKVENVSSLVNDSKLNTEKISDNLMNLRERVAHLEAKLDNINPNKEVLVRCVSEINSLKSSIMDIQKNSKDFRENEITQIEVRIEKLEKLLNTEEKRK